MGAFVDLGFVLSCGCFERNFSYIVTSTARLWIERMLGAQRRIQEKSTSEPKKNWGIVLSAPVSSQ